MTTANKIIIVDYGVGNLHSIQKAVEQFSKNAVISDDAADIESASALILPGVGAFAAGMDGLKIRGLIDPVKKFAASGGPILGICLGAQILLDKGYEFGEHEGLGLISGKVMPFPALENGEKIPEVGWNGIYPSLAEGWNKTILKDTPNNANAYFVHSYILVPSLAENILANSKYGGLEFCSAVRKGNIYGTQFHPEKSGEVGLKIIKNFINII